MMILRWFGEAILAWRAVVSVCVRHALLRRLGRAGRGVYLGDGVKLFAPERMSVGDDVTIGHRVVLRALTAYGWTDPPQRFDPEIVIGRGCYIGPDSHISCANRVTIGPEVMVAERCFITDNNHGYENPDLSIRAQPLRPPGEVAIGEGSWLGTQCVVAGNVSIGRHCVVGANSVVIRSLPDYCVAAGIPARVIKRYDPGARTWVRVP